MTQSGRGVQAQCQRSANEGLWAKPSWLPIFWMACKLRMVFIFFKWLIKIKGRMVFCDVLKLHEIHISVSIHTVFWEHSHVHSLMCWFWLLVQWLIWVFVTETMWFLSLKYLLSVTFQNEFSDPEHSGKFNLGIEFKEAERDFSDNWRKVGACFAMIKHLLKPGWVF